MENTKKTITKTSIYVVCTNSQNVKFQSYISSALLDTVGFIHYRSLKAQSIFVCARACIIMCMCIKHKLYVWKRPIDVQMLDLNVLFHKFKFISFPYFENSFLSSVAINKRKCYRQIIILSVLCR